MSPRAGVDQALDPLDLRPAPGQLERELATWPAEPVGAGLPTPAPLLLGPAVIYPWQGTEPVVAGATREVPWPRPGERELAPDDLLRALADAAVTGRGGAHVPAVVKWRAARAAGPGGVVVANGAEGEPASAKDAALLQHRPHLVLDGLALAARAIGATEGVVWLHEGAVSTERAVRRALVERRAAGFADPPVRIETGPPGYLTGESSAVVRALSGGPALPAARRLPAATAGIHGRPTLVHNPDTLARVALLARGHGIGEPLVTVVLPARRVVLEAPPGATVRSVLALARRAAGAAEPAAEPAAILVGGYGGQWARWADVAGLPVDETAFRQRGLSLGAGVLAALPGDVCGLAETARIARFLADSGARQCGPCLFGLPAIADALESIARGTASRRDVARAMTRLDQVAGRGACHHPDGAVRLVRSALATFAADLASHVGRRRCLHASDRRVLPLPEGR